MYHIPVLLPECMEGLNLKPDGIYVDVTFGGGGHSREILTKLNENGRLLAFDQDDDALQNSLDDPRFTLIHNNFRHLKRCLRAEGIRQVDGILADLGISSHQIDVPERGFSFRFDARLDMRMNSESKLTAADIINTYSPERLQQILSEYGEVRNAKTLTQHIVQLRETRPIRTIDDFVGLIEPMIWGIRPKYLAQLFQALRIEVNDEIGALQDFLTDAVQVLKPEGRLVVMSYHSLEDRPVKNFMKHAAFTDEPLRDEFGAISRPFKLITKKPIEASYAETKQNPRARSAKLRVAERI